MMEMLPIIQFALIAAFFYRQLISVGNPASVIYLVVFAGAWVYVSGTRSVAATAAPLVAVERMPEPGAERRRKKAAELSTVATREAIPSSRAMLRRRRARGAYGEPALTPN